MMKLSFSPIRSDAVLTLDKVRDVLTLNGESYDFSALPEGATLPRAAIDCTWLASDVERIDGVLHLTLILPHGPQAVGATWTPGPVMVAQDGAVVLPSCDVVPNTAEAL